MLRKPDEQNTLFTPQTGTLLKSDKANSDVRFHVKLINFPGF